MLTKKRHKVPLLGFVEGAFFLQNRTGRLKYHIPAFLLTVLFLVQQLTD